MDFIVIKREIKEESDDFVGDNTKFEAVFLDQGFDSHGDNIKEEGREDNKNSSHNEDNDKEQFKCGKCCYKTIKKSNFNRHLTIHNKKSYLKCHFCHFMAATSLTLNAHILRKHELKNKIKITCKIYTCKKCLNSTVRKSNYDNHIKACLKLKNVKWYECEVCNYKSIQKSNLITHVKSHNKIKKLKCLFCKYKSNLKQTLDNHILSKHFGLLNKDNQNCITSKVHDCQHCKYKTTIAIHLRNHLNSNH